MIAPEGSDTYNVGNFVNLLPSIFEEITSQTNTKSPKMRFGIHQIALYCAFVGINAQAVQDKCPKGDYDCLDVINSSQCLEQLVIEHLSPVTKEAMVKCVEYNGTATNTPGATKVSRRMQRYIGLNRYMKNIRLTNVRKQLCRCPGCHSAPINEKISELFPPPCA